MFQSFESNADPSLVAGRVTALRSLLADAGLDGFLVPRSDEHQGEYVPASAERLAWLTGFTGSAGAALVLSDRAILFVDGRYTLQASMQTDTSVFEIASLIEAPPSAWIEANLAPGLRLGFDPWLHTMAEADALRKAVGRKQGELVATDRNPVDEAWHDRPAPPLGKVELHPEEFAGLSASDKLTRLSTTIAAASASHAVLTDPASLAWTFNLRGSDVPHTPLPLGFAIIGAEGDHRIFLHPSKVDGPIRHALEGLASLAEPHEFVSAVETLARRGAAIGLDPALAPEKLRLVIEMAGGIVTRLPDPARLLRATKTVAELAGSRAAHRRDGAAIVAFLAWLGAREPGSVDEIGAATRLEQARVTAGEAAQQPLREISFDTISGSGPNGAIIHYRVTKATNRRLQRGELYLVDSGGQYRDGTTDITRTVAIGEPTAEMRDRYTRVLKGMIGITLLRFPEGTRGCDIDAVARLSLWQAGLDYAHGTGHGVGSYLSVHEGPQRIARTGTEILRPGMILSNEPGYYKEGAYGIRLENLVAVSDASMIDGGDKPMHGFETLTLAPFDRRLVEAGMLSLHEKDWLNAYHKRVLDEIGPLVEEDERQWLIAATAPI